jgi:transcriptional antiterminator RfaH
MVALRCGAERIMVEWRLIRTKSGKERSVLERLVPELPALFLPQMKTRALRRGKLIDRVVPLFPCYLFARFDVQSQYRRVRYTPGIREVLSAGGEFSIVPREIVEDLQQRCAHGPIEISPEPLRHGERVRVMDGPFRGIDAVFESYLPGNERVRILLSTLSNAGPRIVLSSASISIAVHAGH